MLTRLADYIRRHHLGLIAIFIALGGSAYAASKIEAGDIARDAVRAKHIKTGAVGPNEVRNNALTADEVKDDSLTGDEVKDDSLTGGDIQESSLGALLQGGPEARFVERFGDSTPNPLGGGDTCTIGEIELWAAGAYPSANRAPADGKIINIGSNTILFSKIGNTYGGDPNTPPGTFAYPDLRQVTPDKTVYTICTVGIF